VPIVLERLVRWAATYRHAEIDVVAIRGGGLEPAVATTAASVTVLEPFGRRSGADALSAGLASVGRAEWGLTVRSAAWRRRIHHLPAPDVTVMHGAGAWPLVPTVPASTPLVVHLHELELAMSRSIPPTARPGLYRRAERVLAVCPEVADLARTDGASGEQLLVVPGVVEPLDPSIDPGVAAVAGEFDGRRIIAGIGTPGWRKGADRFVALAHELSRTHPDVRCVWVGGSPSGASAGPVGPADPVTWVESRPDPWSVVGGADALIIPSREDPLPLVALEAAQRLVPVVCAATGGLPQLFDDGRGRVVPAYDLRQLHAAVADLLDDPEGARAMAGATRDHVERFYTVDHVGPIWWSAIDEVVGSRSV
jgi:glycosyltransferase involved in cell wall biosynthesis